MNVSRDKVVQDVIKTFINVVGFFNDKEINEINEQTDIVNDYGVDGDDCSLVIEELERLYSVKPGHDEWKQVSLISEIADVIIKHLETK